MAALTAHYVTHARFLWKWLRNPDNRRNKLPFRQKRWAFQPVPLPLRQIQNRFVYGNSIYREKDLGEMMAQTDAFVEKVAALQRKGDGKRLGKWLTGKEVCGQLRISCARCRNCGTGLYRLFANRLPFLLQAGRCKKAYTAYRYNLPH